MKKWLFLSILLTPVLLVSCEKSGGGGTGVCGSSVNVCFDLDGNTVSMQAEWFQVNPTRFRIYWEETSGSNYKNLEVDLYNNISVRSYTITSSPSSDGEASFQYYLNVGGVQSNYQGTSGSVSVTAFSSDQITGNFSLMVNEAVSGNNFSITNGHIDAVPKQ